MLVDAIVLGSGKIKLNGQSRLKGLIEVAGRPMIDRVIDVLDEALSVGRVVVMMPPEAPEMSWPGKADVVLEAAPHISDSVTKGGAHFGGKGWALIVSSDLPLLTVEAVEDFLARCREIDADIYYPIVDMERVRSEFSGSKRTTMRLQEGTFTGGNIALIRKEAIATAKEGGEQAFSRRKSPIRLLMMLGVGFVLRLFAHRLSIEELERKAGELLGVRVAAIETPFPGIGVDVDKPDDIIVAEARLSRADSAVQRQ